MLKRLVIAAVIGFTLTGCSTIQKYWPRAHDPQMANMWVQTKISLDRVDCSAEQRGWDVVYVNAQQLALYTEFRKDPQAENMRGLSNHADKMSKGGSKTFCELGKKTADGRLTAARTSWEGR
jgi:2-keto-3-deoxy-L-rhamnonate aldolase RhmA